MKTIRLLALLLFVSSALVFAQTPAPPPPPLIFSKPDPSEVFEYTAEDNSFKATFPGKLSLSDQVLDKAFIRRYRVYRKGSNSIIGVTTFKTKVSEKYSKIFSAIRESLAKLPKTSIVVDKDIKFGGKTAHEFEILSDFQYRRIRIFVIGAQIFEIQSDVTNWHIIGDKIKMA
ncbi:MAG: hypothetical protein H0V90_08810 [Blastocatellia bacterium]|nr:hypothetical protein [Blastocatellia bacterium]